jgi:tetratricopeptide (TPR) repeat protein
MGKACSSCGAMAASEARFCRLCGAPLRFAETDGGDVSPLAQTVPLSGEGRHTDGFTPGDSKRSADTSRVRREEIERLLHRSAIEPASDGDHDGPIIIPVVSDFVAPNTSELAPHPVAQKASAPSQVQAQAQAQARTRRPRRRFLLATVLCAALVALGASSAFFWTRWRAGEKPVNAPETSNGESQVSVDAQLSEAQSLLASGETGAALARLRALVQREPSNGVAHRLLGEALLRSGQRRDAIAEYNAATRLDAKDAAAWRALASAQFAEELYADSVESYRRLIALTGEDGIDDNARLEYADALRLAGYTDDARAVYQKVEAGAPVDLARQATKHLSELTPAKPATIASNIEPAHAAESPAREMHAEVARNRPLESPAPAPPSASPSPAASPAPHGSPEAVPKNNVAQTDSDAYYFQALSIVNGREPKNLPRPELLRALQLFQNAAGTKGSAHREQAQKYAERLGREFDRRPRQK